MAMILRPLTGSDVVMPNIVRHGDGVWPRANDGRQIRAQMKLKDSRQRRYVRHWNIDTGFETPRAQQRRINPLRKVCCSDDDHAFSFGNAVKQLQHPIDK